MFIKGLLEMLRISLYLYLHKQNIYRYCYQLTTALYVSGIFPYSLHHMSCYFFTREVDFSMHKYMRHVYRYTSRNIKKVFYHSDKQQTKLSIQRLNYVEWELSSKCRYQYNSNFCLNYLNNSYLSISIDSSTLG